MRVYEYAKLHSIQTKMLLDALNKGGFVVKSHMSLLTDKELIFLDQLFKVSRPTSGSAIAADDKQAPGLKPHENNNLFSSISSGDAQKKQRGSSVSDKQSAPLGHKPQALSSVEQHTVSPFVIRSMMLSDAADELKQPVATLIITLLRWGIIATKNQVLDEAVVARLAENFNVQSVRRSDKEQTQTKSIVIENGEYKERLPVVVVVGHVDHGKTTLLDYIRKTRVALKEKGGITQHLGAYEATTSHGNLIFIDTPGHEAFARMRARGIGLADVAVLVIAADDGVMPQTIEAIKHIKLMKLPIVVALNKIDKADKSRVEAIKRDLAQHGLVPEEWSGDTVIVPMSAKTGAGVDQLLEMITLQAHLLELKADISGFAKGYILESSVEKGRGFVATVLAQHGSIAVGDYFVCGKTTGRISSLIDSHGARIMSAGPSYPVRVAGFSGLPQAGDYFEAVSKETYLKARSSDLAREVIPAAALAREHSIPLIVKTDNHSSREALVESVIKLSKKAEKPFSIIHAAIGDITETDVNLAATSGARIIGLHVKIPTLVFQAAQEHAVKIELFDIIYKLLDYLQQLSDSFKVKQIVKVKTGEAEVRRVFDIKGQGVIAGCYVKDGRFVKDGIIVAWRGKIKLGEGKIKSLQRDRKTVKEVAAGYECAFLVEGVNDWAEHDRAECFIEQ